MAGAQEGSYLMLPFLGPKPPRDLVGMGVDGVFDPFTWARFPGRHELLTVRSAVDVLDTADRTGPVRTSSALVTWTSSMRDRAQASIDFYASTRNLYRQSRNAQIQGDEPPVPESSRDL